MTHREVADGGDGLQIWRVPANVLNNRRQPKKGDSPAWDLGEEVITRGTFLSWLMNCRFSTRTLRRRVR